MADLEIKITNSQSDNATGGAGGFTSSEQTLNQFMSIIQTFSRSLENAAVKLDDVATKLDSAKNQPFSEQFMKNTADHINAQNSAYDTGEAIARNIGKGGGGAVEPSGVESRTGSTRNEGGATLSNFASLLGGYSTLNAARQGLSSYISERNILAGSDYSNTTGLTNELLQNEFEQKKSIMQLAGSTIGGAAGFMVGGTVGAGIGAGIGAGAAGYGYDYLAGADLAAEKKANVYDQRARELMNYGYAGAGASSLMQSGINQQNPEDVVNMQFYKQFSAGFAKYGYMSQEDLRDISTSARTHGGIDNVNQYSQDISQISGASGVTNQNLIKMVQDAQSVSGTRQDELAAMTRQFVQQGGMSATEALKVASQSNLYGEGFSQQQQQFITSSPLDKFKSDITSDALYGFKMSDLYSGDQSAMKKYRNIVNQANQGDFMAMAFTDRFGYAMPDMYGAGQGEFGTSSYEGYTSGESGVLSRLKGAQQQVENAKHEAVGYAMEKVGGKWQYKKDSQGNKIPEAYGEYQIMLSTAKQFDPNATPEKLMNPSYNEVMHDKIMAANRHEANQKGFKGTQAELYAMALYNGRSQAKQFEQTGHSEYTDKVLSKAGGSSSGGGSNIFSGSINQLINALNSLNDTLRRSSR